LYSRTTLRLWIPFFLCLSALLSSSRALAEPAHRIYAGVYLHDVTKFEQKDGVFDVDLELWAKWLGDFDPEKLVIANAAEVERELIGKESDGAWRSARWRVKGTLRGEFPVHRFPFDRQTLRVELELPEREGELLPDLAGSGMRERFSVTGWLYEPAFVPRVGQETYHSDLGSIAEEGRSTSVRRTAFEVTLGRPLLTAATKLFLPLIVILLVALVALFIHPRELEVRASVGVTALLACFAFHFAVSDTMPNVAYVTLADVLFLASYGLTAALLCVSVIAYSLHDRGRESAWRKLDVGSLLGFPVVLGLTILAAVREPPTAHAAPAPAAQTPRPASARKLLRVGTASLQTASAGLVARGANWGTLRTALDGTRVPVLVEEVPAITNDALRFLAGGELEVTWRLRSGLKWSDGKPLTADDLHFALQVSPDERIADAKVVGPRELVVRFHERRAAALESITPLPRHALEAEYKKGGYAAVREYRRKHVTPSAGPYKVTEFVVDDHVFLEANPHFSGPPPSIERIEVRRYPDDQALVAAFEQGAIDMVMPNAVSPETAQELAKRRPEAVKIRPSEVQVVLNPDLDQPLLARRDVRRALLMALDRERIRTEVFGEVAASANVSHVPVPGALPAGVTPVGHDAAAARKALEAAGAVGIKLPLSHGKAPVDKAIAVRVVRDLAAVGITLEPREVPSVFDVYRARKHGGLLLMSTTGERDSDPERYWSVPQVDGKFDRKFRSEPFDDSMATLADREQRALYPERREQIRDLLFAAYAERLPNLPILFLADRIITVPDLDGWKEGSGRNFGTTIESWHFKPAAP
jgi:peptide/nickel transport system substrate-binding protein